MAHLPPQLALVLALLVGHASSFVGVCNIAVHSADRPCVDSPRFGRRSGVRWLSAATNDDGEAPVEADVDAASAVDMEEELTETDIYKPGLGDDGVFRPDIAKDGTVRSNFELSEDELDEEKSKRAVYDALRRDEWVDIDDDERPEESFNELPKFELPPWFGKPEQELGLEEGEFPEIMGDFDGTDDPLDAPWRREAEDVMREAVAACGRGLTLADVLWDHTEVLLSLEPAGAPEPDRTAARRAVRAALDGAVDARLRVLQRHTLAVTSAPALDSADPEGGVILRQEDLDACVGQPVLVSTEDPISEFQGLSGRPPMLGRLGRRDTNVLRLQMGGALGGPGGGVAADDGDWDTDEWVAPEHEVQIPCHMVAQVRLPPPAVAARGERELVRAYGWPRRDLQPPADFEMPGENSMTLLCGGDEVPDDPLWDDPVVPDLEPGEEDVDDDDDSYDYDEMAAVSATP